MNINHYEFAADSDPESNYTADECRVCRRSLEANERVSYYCDHVFCRPCIEDFMFNTGDETCPICSGQPDERPQFPRTAEVIMPSGNQNLLVRRPVPGEGICGICRKRESDVRRGRISCCDHFYCFRCILDWAQTSPRCPQCTKVFHEIESVYPPNMRLTRSRAAYQHNIWDLPLDDWADPPDDPDDVFFRERCVEGPRDESSFLVGPRNCALCAGSGTVGRGGSLRKCRTCRLYIHHVCADPIWSHALHRWLCAVCVTRPQ